MSGRRGGRIEVSKGRMYEVIRAPHITEKSTLISEHNAVAFKVAIDATKPEIKAAVEGLFGVKVKIRAGEYPALEPDMISGDYDASLLSRGYLVDVADPGGYLASDWVCEGGYNLGGEQSGHVILSDHATTGDGILTTLHVMERMATTGKSLAELASVMTRLPQVLVNVAGVDKSRADEDAVLAAAVSEEEAALGERGRILLRPSGTEPIVRVMVEAPTQDEAQGVASRLADVVRRQLSLS
mgnify:CR=1 FL=1